MNRVSLKLKNELQGTLVGGLLENPADYDHLKLSTGVNKYYDQINTMFPIKKFKREEGSIKTLFKKSFKNKYQYYFTGVIIVNEGKLMKNDKQVKFLS
jgi:hypothetical protein